MLTNHNFIVLANAINADIIAELHRILLEAW